MEPSVWDYSQFTSLCKSLQNEWTQQQCDQPTWLLQWVGSCLLLFFSAFNCGSVLSIKATQTINNIYYDCIDWERGWNMAYFHGPICLSVSWSVRPSVSLSNPWKCMKPQLKKKAQSLSDGWISLKRETEVHCVTIKLTSLTRLFSLAEALSWNTCCWAFLSMRHVPALLISFRLNLLTAVSHENVCDDASCDS